jgi:hypothetical protein
MMVRLSLIVLAAALILLTAGCSDEKQIQRTIKAIGAEKLRHESLAVCRGQFPREGALKIPNASWPPSIVALHPVSLWMEPDGAYALLHSDADGERGVYVPRILSEKDPICTPQLTHVKLAPGVYWYERKRL